MSDSNQKKKALPTFSGMGMPMNVSINVDDDIGEETTRRVGGFTPSFEPVAFHTPPRMAPPSFQMGPAINTAPQKAMGTLPVPKTGWNLSEAPILPEFHPLERSSVFVPHTRPSEVSSRVSDVLRERSIEATYDNAKAKARCVTADQVEFRVFLYRGQKKYSHGIIVEVQRRYGASTSFIADVRAILDAAEGKVPPPPPPMTRAELPLVSDSEDDFDEASVSDSSLDFVRNMFAHSVYDAHVLALQTLSSLTDAAKMGRATARGVSKTLTASDNEVGNKVFGFIVDAKYQNDEFSSVRALAMTVLANAVSAVKGDISTEMREALRPVLVGQLRSASKNPQMAFLASKCLEYLVRNDHNPSELHGALEEAGSVGEARHAGLKKQAKKCIEKIEMR